MSTSKSVCSVIALFLFSTFSHTISLEPVVDEKSLSQSYDESNGGAWELFQNPLSSDYPISESSGKIYTPFGIFDPLSEDLPVGPWQISGLQQPHDGRLHIVQSQTSDLQDLENSLASIGFDIIDQIPYDSVIISLSEGDSDE